MTSPVQHLSHGHAAPPGWASAWGEDKYGIYVEFEYQGVTQRLRWIAPGRFKMGSPEAEPERIEDEVLHEVTLTEGYWMADTACTQELWHAVMGSDPNCFKDDPDEQAPKRPVEQRSWGESKAFCGKLNELYGYDGQGFRLPTEAEWEYACRCGTETAFSFGEDITPEQVNYRGNYPYTGREQGEHSAKTVPVKALPANAWGLHEMHGNVWEWCEDWYGDYDLQNVVDPKGPPQGKRRVSRGGAWSYVAMDSRSASRYYNEPGFRILGIGFRLVRGR